jgi:hypothetical protein
MNFAPCQLMGGTSTTPDRHLLLRTKAEIHDSAGQAAPGPPLFDSLILTLALGQNTIIQPTGGRQLGRYDSFPGGHAITAFSLATVVAVQYRKSVWVPIVAYSVATGVGLSRVTETSAGSRRTARWAALSVTSSAVWSCTITTATIPHNSHDRQRPRLALIGLHLHVDVRAVEGKLDLRRTIYQR